MAGTLWKASGAADKRGVNERNANPWWALLPVAVVGLYFVHTTVSLVLAGLVAICAGLAVATNYRGAAETLPSVLAWSWLSHPRTRQGKQRSFVLVAVWGVLVVTLALMRPELLKR